MSVTRWVEVDGEGVKLTIPTRKEVCFNCRGEGALPYGGGVSYTGSEWAEACDGDPDFAEDYASGRYDQPCRECKGLRVVDVEDWDLLPAEIRRALEDDAEAEADYQARSAAERRMGA